MSQRLKHRLGLLATGAAVLVAATALAGCATATVAEVDGGKQRATPDASRGTGPADARQPPDARLSPDANTCSTAPFELLGNGSFDEGTAPWVASAGDSHTIIVNQSAVPSVSAESGMFLAWLAGYSTLLLGTDTLQQDFSVPSNTAKIVVSGQIWIDSAEILGIPYDTLALELVDVTSGAVLETLKTWSNLDEGTAWASFSVALVGNYGGQQIRLRWTSDIDFSRDTSFWIDSVSAKTSNTCL